jgi:hypothetical protein
MSPWGGYGKPHDDRVAYGKQQGFETNDRGFALSGPVYYQRFRDTCLDMIRRFGVNQFKFDGTGNAASTAPGSAFDSDFDAAIHLIGELRAEKPDLYVNLTTGTYPSPFWLRWADSIWRGGEDHIRPRRARRSALPAQLTDAARPDLREVGAQPEHGSGQRLRVGGSRLLRERDAIAGDVHHAGIALERELGRHRDARKMVARQRG